VSSLRVILFAAVACVVSTHTVTAQSEGAKVSEPRPNVLFLVIDDLNDWVGCLGGHPQTKTPNIDRLAARGVLFTNAHCQAPICNPSRVSMMTGRLPSTTGVYLLQPSRFRVSKALAKVKTLPEYFSAHGYHAMGGGKLYHGSTSRETFDEYGPRGSFGPLPKKNAKFNFKTGHRLWDWGEFPATDAETPDARVADWAIKQLKRKHDKPFFLAVGFFRPHVPMYAPPKWWKQLPAEKDIELPPSMKGDRDDVPDYGKRLTQGFPAPRHEWFVKNKQWRRAVRGYLACVSFVDNQVGRVMAELDRSGYASNTIIVLCSDHGFHLGEKERWAKRSLWTRSTRVPLIVVPPGRNKATKCEKPVGLIDLYPTFVELCGLPANKGLEGRSLVPLLRDRDAAWDRPIITTFYKDNHSLRSERWRYTRYADGSEELYDLRSDPHEWYNVASKPKLADVVRKLRRHLPTVNVEAVPGSKGLGGQIKGVK
jgi:choline-sulfatase